MTPREVAEWKLELSAMSLLEIKAAADDSQRGLLAVEVYVREVIGICTDLALGHDEPGWHSISPLYGLIEYQGEMPQDARNSGKDRMLNAASTMQSSNPDYVEAITALGTLTARQQVAVLVDELGSRMGYKRPQICKTSIWQGLIYRLQLTRWLEPGKLSPMTSSALSTAEFKARMRLESTFSKDSIVA